MRHFVHSFSTALIRLALQPISFLTQASNLSEWHPRETPEKPIRSLSLPCAWLLTTSSTICQLSFDYYPDLGVGSFCTMALMEQLLKMQRDDIKIDLITTMHNQEGYFHPETCELDQYGLLLKIYMC